MYLVPWYVKFRAGPLFTPRTFTQRDSPATRSLTIFHAIPCYEFDTFRAYSSNEELVAKASGGSALYGMNFFATSTDMVLKPYAPIIATPSYVEM